jgi:hypothetical protein
MPIANWGIGVAALVAFGAACAPRAGAVATAAPGATVGACRPEDRAFAEASRALAALSTQVDAVADREGLAAAQDKLAQLLATPCFARSTEESRSFRTESVVAFKTWWKGGGAAWVRAYLHGAPALRRAIVVPPDVRPSIALEDAKGGAAPHRLAAWACSWRDSACSAETAAWRDRATRFFDAKAPAAAERARETDVACAEPAARHDYLAWRACVAGRARRVPALPAGDIRAPRSGWLVLRGPSAKAGCTETNAYHLETGAAYRAEPCGHGAAPTMKAGRVSPEGAREALWMLLLAPEVADAQTASEIVPLPPGMEPVWPQGEGSGFMPGSTFSGSAHAVSIGWSWLDGDRTLVGGAFVMPGRTPGEEYEGSLVEALDASFVPGSAPVAPPPALGSGAR